MENTNKKTLYLFTDGSVNPQEKIGYGAYLLLTQEQLDLQYLNEEVQLKRFENTSSTKLEVETLLWALKNHELKNNHMIIYTDCQNILGLKDRRKRFEENDYYTKKHKRIANHELYKQFYILTDELDCEFVKVKGHKAKDKKDKIDKIFTLVDKGSRNALREEKGHLAN